MQIQWQAGGEMMKLNKNQQKAVTTIDKNVSVNAGAGSGKTKVLVERYIYLLENGEFQEGKEVESIVAITFTKKASQEMKGRIRQAIRDKFSKGEKWKRLYRDIERANISTIHSFCSRLIRENPIEAKVDPAFKIFEEYEADDILHEVIKDYFMHKIEFDDNMFESIKSLNLYDLDTLIENVISVYKKVRSTGISFSKVKEMTLNNIDNAEIQKEIIEAIKENLTILIEKARKNSKLAKLKDDPRWLEFLNCKEYKNDVFDTLVYLSQNIGTMKGEEERINYLQDLIKRSLKAKEKERRNIYLSLLDSLIEIDNEFQCRKNKLGYLDYEDLQIKVLELLQNKSIREKYQNKFKYIMIDEFQDTNELQKKIVYKLCSKDSKLDRENLFVVGDPKQSIYAFRGADIDVFYDVMNDMEEVSKFSPIILDENYRSLNTVLEFINSLFEKLMGSKYDSLSPSPNNISNNKVDVEILEKEDLEIPEDISKGDYSKIYESRLVAKRIKSLVQEENYSYGDIVLLFRSSTDDYLYEEALREYGIPYYNLGGKGFYRQQEIVDIINALKGISNRYDTISLVGTLRSPMFGVSDKTIYWLLKQKNDNLLDTLNSDIKNIDDAERGKLKKAYNILKILSIKKDMIGVYEIMKELIDKTYYIESTMLKFGNRQAIANIYKLLEIARGFNSGENNTIEDFIDYIEELNTKDVDESQAKIEGENGNSVKLMTIHKSKGLQFKVVIIPQMAKSFMNENSSILFHKKLGIGIKGGEISPIYDEISKELKEKENEENKRILYVAMTRAEEKLIIGNQGSEKGFKSFIKDFLQSLNYDILSDIDVEEESFETIKKIDSSLKTTVPFDEKQFPLIQELGGLNHKTFKYYSITQFLNFKECKRKFYMTYYKNLPVSQPLYEDNEDITGSSLNGAIRGEIVHKFCEIYRTGEDKKVLLDKIIRSFGIIPTEGVLGEVMPYIDIYLKHYDENIYDVLSEKKFYYKVMDSFVHGVIDRINIKNGKAEILDFKTNRVVNKESLMKKYSPQLQLYAKAFSDIYEIEVHSAKLFLLETGEFVDIDIKNDALNKNLGDLAEFIRFVSSNNDIENYEKSQICNSYCNFNIICNK